MYMVDLRTSGRHTVVTLGSLFKELQAPLADVLCTQCGRTQKAEADLLISSRCPGHLVGPEL